MVFFTAQCKAVSMMDLPHKEAAENTPRTNTVTTLISTKSQTLLRLKHANNKATKLTPMMTRLHLKSDELSLLTCQAKSLKISCPGLPAVVVVVKAIGKHSKLQVFEMS